MKSKYRQCFVYGDISKKDVDFEFRVCYIFYQERDSVPIAKKEYHRSFSVLRRERDTG